MAADQTVPEQAQAMLAILDRPEHWIKYRERSEDGSRHCIATAAWMVTVDRLLLLDRIADVIAEQYPDRKFRPLGSRSPLANVLVLVQEFNDHDDTTYADVRLVLEKVAAG